MEAIQGKSKILMFRLLSEANTRAAAKLALQTEHSFSYSRNTNSTQTKDGAVNSGGGLETTISIEAVSSRDEINLMLKNSVIEGTKLEVWEIDLDGKKDASGKYPALYARGDLASWEVPANVEDLETISTEMNVDGKPVPGFVSLTEDQESEIQYAFRDITKYTDPEEVPGA
ncbi:phage major tail protein, TP901-1 family [Listeria monocytogenes]|uniref:phage major tail protein, TP901-1 family n=1 Tax=Listeria monocytogenes TaxID=1639 RepID=UPI000BE00F8D|nr:phage major tail protein, TP901-1 family [Listeria monocytogenes]EAE4828480.1 phage major tail protein, TP901-1 family [Listeria monocytogenes]EAE5878543.1 phage major tail protein, TP901-1 family [Listeria monocytogenes]EDP7666801.1 phage major tail protein, TP901-1 family [Listeria monocytogenes]EEO3389658.1 phage major tail protein, TP901-1 family [Listeria monocytogenes]EEO3692669.1 phage major tail protein, TP901-1 family [Listeria monocytogenes]